MSRDISVLVKTKEISFSLPWEVRLALFFDSLLYPYLLSDTFSYSSLTYNEGTWPSSGQQNVMREPLRRFAISHPSVSMNPVDTKIHRCTIPYIKQHIKMCQVNNAQTTIAEERMRIFENGWRLQQGMPTYRFIHMDLA